MLSVIAWFVREMISFLAVELGTLPFFLGLGPPACCAAGPRSGGCVQMRASCQGSSWARQDPFRPSSAYSVSSVSSEARDRTIGGDSCPGFSARIHHQRTFAAGGVFADGDSKV